MAFHRKDHFYKQAKEEGLRSRAAYKLEELHKRFQLFPKGGRVLDLGAAPGGWLQIAAEIIGPSGRIVGIDLLPIDPLPFRNITLLQGDLLDEGVQKQAMDALEGKAHTVLSDMAPNISGIRITDCARSYDLALIALQIAEKMLVLGGSMVVKIFPGDDFEAFLFATKNLFKKVRTTRPEATRKTSSEVYVIATQFRGTPLVQAPAAPQEGETTTDAQQEPSPSATPEEDPT